MRVECPPGTIMHGDVCSPEVVVDCPTGTRYVDTRGCVADQAATAAPSTESTNERNPPPAPTSLTVHSGDPPDPHAKDCYCLPNDPLCSAECGKKLPPTPPADPFDRQAAIAALQATAGAAKSCKKDDDPPAKANVRIVFAASGRVKSVEVGSPFAGTPTGACIAGAFRGARIPPFVGEDVTVSKPISL